jgi:hypothetical protein
MDIKLALSLGLPIKLTAQQANGLCQQLINHEKRIAELKKAWISVEDNLPAEYKFVLCWFEGRSEVMQIMWETPSFEETFKPFPYWIDGDERFTPDWQEITHWMPLPDPPKDRVK